MTDRETNRPISLDEPISPELALVDPELARRARSLLPDVGRPPRPLDAASTRTSGTRRASGAGDAAARPVAVRQRRSRYRRALTATLALVAGLAAGTLGIGLFSGERRPVLASDDAGRRNFGGPRVSTAGRGALQPVPRTFVWLPVRGASHYRVDFYRGRQRILRAFPRRSRLVVPARWTSGGRSFVLAPGEYRWEVRPGFGRRTNPRYGRTIVSSSWVLTP